MINKSDIFKVIITIQSVIVAGLLAWAQLWLPTYEIYHSNGDPIWTASLSLTGIYIAVLSSLLGIIFAIYALINPYKKNTLKLTITFFSLSLILIFLTVLVSSASMYIKAWRGDNTWHPIFSGLNATEVTLGTSLLGIAIFFGIWFWLAPIFSNMIVRNVRSEKQQTGNSTEVLEPKDKIIVSRNNTGDRVPPKPRRLYFDLGIIRSIFFYQWLFPSILAALAIILGNWIAGPLSLSSTDTHEASGVILSFIGVVFAVLIGVFTSIHVQSRQNKFDGFRRFREGVITLENLVIGTSLKTRRNKKWANWINQTEEVNVVLNNITMGWVGWDIDKDFEGWLVEKVNESSQVTSNLGDEGEHVYRVYRQAVKEILIGLHSMDEGIVGQHLVKGLFIQLGTLLILILFTIAIFLSTNIGSKLGSSSIGNVYYIVALSIITVAHLGSFVAIINRWVSQLDKRDTAWSSAQGIHRTSSTSN